MKKKKIAIIATGGTIAGSGAAGKTTNYEAGTISVDEVLDSIPNIRDRVEIVLDNLFSVDSNEIDDQRWLLLTEHINKLADQQDIDGIVVTHGTDTMEETSYFLNLTVNTLKPVVLLVRCVLQLQQVPMDHLTYSRPLCLQVIVKLGGVV